MVASWEIRRQVRRRDRGWGDCFRARGDSVDEETEWGPEKTKVYILFLSSAGRWLIRRLWGWGSSYIRDRGGRVDGQSRGMPYLRSMSALRQSCTVPIARLVDSYTLWMPDWDGRLHLSSTVLCCLRTISVRLSAVSINYSSYYSHK